jgi:hypothetical protein
MPRAMVAANMVWTMVRTSKPGVTDAVTTMPMATKVASKTVLMK